MQYVGYLMDQKGARPAQEKVAAIINYKKPTNIIELRLFLRMINFYRRFIRNVTAIQAPLNVYLKSAKKNDKRPIVWTIETENAFQSCKDSLANAALVAYPKFNTLLLLTSDASNVARLRYNKK